VWKVVEDKVDKARIAKIKGERTKEIEEKQKEEVNLIKIRMVEEIVSRRFYKCLKVFEKKSERMLMRNTWNHTIDLREGFVPKKRDIYSLSRIERGSSGVCEESVEEGIYLTIKITTDVTGVLCAKEGWEEKDGAGLQISEQLDDQEQLSIATDFRSNG